MMVVFLPLVSARVLLQSRLRDPVMDSMKDSFGKSNLEAPCSKIECGDYECPTPFELKVDATCCGYCYAPDHVVSVDRHKVVASTPRASPSRNVNLHHQLARDR